MEDSIRSKKRRKKKVERATVSMRADGAPWGQTIQTLRVTMPSVVLIEIDKGPGTGPGAGVQTIEILVDKRGVTIGGPR